MNKASRNVSIVPGPTRLRVLSLAVAFAALAAGCQSDTKPVTHRAQTPAGGHEPPAGPPPRLVPPKGQNTDPCAARLHDLSGALFLYYFTYQRLPATLGEVNTFPEHEEEIPLVCPVSNQPYVYTRDGIQLPERHARVLVYDATPAHYGGVRWTIQFEEPGGGKAPVMKVVSLPESFFRFRDGTPATQPTPDTAGNAAP